MKTSPLVLAALMGLISGQQKGTQKEEYHPPMGLKTCKTEGGCKSAQKSVVMDANWRWLHNVGGYTNCYDGNKWNSQYCPDNQSCAKNCALDGVPQQDWANTYGVMTDGNSMSFRLVTQGAYAKNVGARTYMLDDNSNYEKFMLLDQEFTFPVDVSKMPCGVNGALYFVDMDKTGNAGGNNAAGAGYGTGYCDAQCPHDIKFIQGAANAEGW